MVVMGSPRALNDKLLRLYEPLVQRTLETCEKQEWPANAGVTRGLRRDGAGVLVPVRFDDGQGPVGVAAFCPELASIAAAARAAAFEPLLRRIDGSLAEYGAGPASVWWAPESALHFTIYQFTEHPCLMAEDVQNQCRPLSADDDAALHAALLERTSGLTMPRAVLHGLRMMPDGSMLLLFLEAPGAEGSVDALRGACAGAAEAAGQSGQPVRPKDFLHVVVGRVMEVGSLSDEASEALNAAVSKEAVSVAELVLPVHGGSAMAEVLIRAADLVRDWQWFHLDYRTLGSYMLSAPQD